MKLGTEVGLGPGHIMSDGDPACPPQMGTAPQFSAHVYCDKKGAHPHFSARLLWPNSWMNQDATWYEGRLWPRPHCVR